MTSDRKRYRFSRATAAGCVLALLGATGQLAAQEPELVEAFAFNSRPAAGDCETVNEPGRTYTVVFQGMPQDLQYDSDRGWGYEVLYPNDGAGLFGDRGGYEIFGPFDDSANNRTVFPDGCPNDLYDSFIGAKDFTQTCDEFIVGDPLSPCTVGGLLPEGIIFRVDVPNGTYRFVGAVGSADNNHAHRILVENGGSGPPEEISEDHVVLVSNYDQAEYGAGTYAKVGFGCFDVPQGSGPAFVNVDEEGVVTDGPPNSPTLEVTEGYIRVHQLQANSNPGAAGDRDPNGGDMVLLELWEVGDQEIPPGVFTEVQRTFAPDPRMPGEEVAVALEVIGIDAPTTVEETIPDGWEVVDPGDGTAQDGVITFDVDSPGLVEYEVRSADTCEDGVFSAVIQPEGGCESTLGSTLGCRPPACGIQGNGTLSDFIVLGPVDLGRLADEFGACDDTDIDGLNFADKDYLADGEITEATILPTFGDEVAPAFFAEAAGVGVVDTSFTGNPDINPDGLNGILTAWQGSADETGLLDYNLLENMGDVDDFISYNFTYLENTTAECLDVVLEVGSDDAVKVRLNGELVHVNSVCRGVPGLGAGDRVPVSLNPGLNVLMVAIVERGGGAGVRVAVRDTDDNPITDGTVRGICDPPAEVPPYVAVNRTVTPASARPGDPVDVTLSVAQVPGPTTITETLPPGLEVVDAGDGTVDGDTISFTLEEPGDVTYVVRVPPGATCPFDSGVISGAVEPPGGCGAVTGDAGFGCVAPPCPPGPDSEGAELERAFAFGSRDLECSVFSSPEEIYEMVLQTGGDSIAADELEYDPGRGWGYEATFPGVLDVGRFGPFDNTPNGRNKYPDECPEELYDSFIGGKNFTSECSAATVGDPSIPCGEGGILPEGIIFRVDVPDGRYRFAGAFGDADNVHAHRILAENGGAGPPEEISEEHVVLVNNFDQAQQDIGEADAAELGEGVYARVGFEDKVPPPGDSIPPSPQFVNMDADGLATEDCPDSPVLEVTEGYIRIHQLQGNSNNGPGGDRDPNGGDMVILELWRLSDEPVEGNRFLRGDADASGEINITDGIFVLNFLFTGGETPICEDAADVDDAGDVNITDGIFILNFLFTGGDNPPAPHPSCGTDPTDDDVECAAEQPNCGA